MVLKKAGLAMLRLAHAPAAGSFLAGEAQLLLLLTPKVLLGS
jgi:hypothetical protein